MSFGTDEKKEKAIREVTVMPGPGRKFKPGQSGNLKGRPKLPEEIKERRVLTRIEVERIFNHFSHMSLNGLKEFHKAGQGSVLEHMIVSVMAKALSNGDQARLDFVLARTGIILEQKVDHSVTIKNPFQDMSLEEKIERAKEVTALLEAQKK